MSKRSRSLHWISRLALPLLAVPVVTSSVAAEGGADHPRGVRPEQVDHLQPDGVVNLGHLASQPARSTAQVLHITRPKLTTAQHWNAAGMRVQATAAGGPAAAASSSVVMGGDNGSFDAISNVDMETGGTGSYANTNGPLEPPDMGVCAGAGYVMQTVNDSLRVFSTRGQHLTDKSIPLSQFFQRAAGGLTGPTDFMSDPRCMFDHATQRWFVTVLDITSVPAYPSFADDNNLIAVSHSRNPLGDWSLYHFDVTDNGLNKSPMHAGCVGPPIGTATIVGCLGDQPTLGADDNGIYITDNEYAFAEVFPVAPPVIPPLQQIPVLRSGVAQLYALSKQQLVSGTQTTLVRFDSSTIPFPGPAEDSPWQSITPAQLAPGATPPSPTGVEYFLSDVGLPVGHNANQIVVWAWLNTASLATANPDLALQHTIIDTAGPADTFFVPDPAAPSSTPFAAYQKDGPHPIAAAAGDPEEYLNANDDRMNWVTYSRGTLWTSLNTQLPPSSPGASGHAGENRVGIMYFQVVPSIVGGDLHASVLRDGYISVPDNNVMFGAVAARADGATIFAFTLAGIDWYPSSAWARVDGLAPGQAPVVHVARRGVAPEDGFTGLGLLGSQGIGLPDVPPCGPCVARWGDYSAAAIDENGCVWGATEDIPTGQEDDLKATDWGTGIFHVCAAQLHNTATASSTPTPVATPGSGGTGSGSGIAGLPNTAAAANPAGRLAGPLGLLLLATTAMWARRRSRRA
jgi:hypothetical protein